MNFTYFDGEHPTSRAATIGFEPMIPVRCRMLSASSRLRQGFKLTHKLRLLNDGLPPLPVYGLGADLIPLARLERDRMPYEGDRGAGSLAKLSDVRTD